MSHERKAQSAYALHILKTVHEYGPINKRPFSSKYTQAY